MGRSPCCDENGLKKGPWTPEEDEKLVQYIHKHGHGSWRALPKLSGLHNYKPPALSLYEAFLHDFLFSLQVLTDAARAVGYDGQIT